MYKRQQEVILATLVIRFQHIQESPHVKILLTGSLLFQDILIQMCIRDSDMLDVPFVVLVDRLRDEIYQFRRLAAEFLQVNVKGVVGTVHFALSLIHI